MRVAQTLSAVVVAALCACGGGSSNNPDTSTGGADAFTLTIYGSTTTYHDAAATSVIAYASGPLTTVGVSGSGVVIYVMVPAGQTGTVVGAFDAVIGGNHCVEGTLTINVSAHGTTMGSVVSGSFGPVSVTCPVGPSPQTVSGSFSATRI